MVMKMGPGLLRSLSQTAKLLPPIRMQSLFHIWDDHTQAQARDAHPTSPTRKASPLSSNRIRRIEFSDLPKTISGKIRRVELRHAEALNVERGARPPFEFREEDFVELH